MLSSMTRYEFHILHEFDNYFGNFDSMKMRAISCGIPVHNICKAMKQQCRSLDTSCDYGYCFKIIVRKLTAIPSVEIFGCISDHSLVHRQSRAVVSFERRQ